MKDVNSVKWAACTIGAVLLAASVSGQNRPPVPGGFGRMEADEIKTGTIWGDPSKPGMYVTCNRFAPGSYSSPHCHDQDRYVTVIKGTWYVSLGPESDANDREKMTALKPGSFVVHLSRRTTQTSQSTQRICWDFSARSARSALIVVT